MHILPEAEFAFAQASHKYLWNQGPWCYILALFSFLVVLYLEKVQFADNHMHSHDNNNTENEHHGHPKESHKEIKQPKEESEENQQVRKNDDDVEDDDEDQIEKIEAEQIDIELPKGAIKKENDQQTVDQKVADFFSNEFNVDDTIQTEKDSEDTYEDEEDEEEKVAPPADTEEQIDSKNFNFLTNTENEKQIQGKGNKWSLNKQKAEGKPLDCNEKQK